MANQSTLDWENDIDREKIQVQDSESAGEDESTHLSCALRDSENVDGIHILPDEMIEMILLEVDSVTRKRAERVCKRWLRLIRGSYALRVKVKIDVARLPVVSYKKFQSNVQLLIPADVKRILITDESNPEKPWITGNNPSSYYSMDLVVDTFRSIGAGFETGGLTAARPFTVVLDKLSMRSYAFDADFLNWKTICCLEIRQVRVCHLSIVMFSAGELKMDLVRWIQHWKLDSSLASSRPDVELLRSFGSENGPLSNEEYSALARISQSYTDKCKRYVAGFLYDYGLIAHVDLDWSAVGEGNGLCPFASRLLIASELEQDVLNMWAEDSSWSDPENSGSEDDDDDDED